MAPEAPDSSNMVDLAGPARFRHVVVLAVCAALIGLLVWARPEMGEELDAPLLLGLLFLTLWVVFPFTRSLHALFARPHFRANGSEISLRHWGGDWSLFIPFQPIRNDRLRWSEIRSVSRKRTTYDFIVVEDYAIIECADREPVQIHRGVFNLSVEAILNMIQSRIAVNELRDMLPSDCSQPYVQRLARYFAGTLTLRYSRSFIRLAGLVIGPPVAFVGWRWLFSHAGEKLGLDIAIALCSCGAIAWLIYAIDEAVRSARYRDKNFWFRVTGLATGSDEFSAQSYRWSEVVGARRRIQHMAGLWDTRKKPKFDGLEVLLRGGGTIWIPEEYSNDLDQLCEVLSPNDTEVITRGDQAAKC